MKVSEIILGKGRDRKRRGPRPGWEKRIGFHNKMKNVLNAEMKPVISESGSMPGTGAIHISEIKPTIQKLEKELNMSLMNDVLGSVGKKEFSGDMDIAIDVPPEKFDEFFKLLQSAPSVEAVTKSSVFMTTVSIENYNPNLETDKLRTGKVQVDFMPGEPGWLKTYYHSPHEKDSRYKGVYRTTFLATIAASYKQINSEETTEHGTPLESERFKFSPTEGLIRVKRTPVPKAKGDGYTKKNNDELIDGPWRTADEIARQLNLGSGENLDSFETLFNAVKNNWSPQEAEKVFRDFANSRQTKELGVPEEIKGYVE